MEQQEFEQCWRHSEPRVRAFLAAAGADPTVVQDLTQEAALAAWRKRNQFDREREFLAWVIGIARFCLLRHRRDQARSRVLLAPKLIDQLAETMVTQQEVFDRRQAALAACHEQLDDASRELLELRLGEGLPLAEVAERLGRRHGAVRTAFSRLRAALRACVERRLGGVGSAAGALEEGAL